LKIKINFYHVYGHATLQGKIILCVYSILYILIYIIFNTIFSYLMSYGFIALCDDKKMIENTKY